MDRPTVFISYSQESPEHAERVRRLAASLERDGCACRLDVHKDTAEDWPTWMTRQLVEADSVLCVVTETYEKRFRDRELPDVGLGVGWEAGLIRRLLYKEKLRNDRIFPLCFDANAIKLAADRLSWSIRMQKTTKRANRGEQDPSLRFGMTISRGFA